MKKKILIFISHYLPGNKMGGPIQSIRSLVYYLKDEFDISIYTSNYDFGEKETYKNIEFNKWLEIDGAKVYYSSKVTLREINQILSLDFDWIYLNSFFSFKFSILPILIKKYFIKNKSRILLAPRGEFSPGALSLKKIKKRIYINLFKNLKIYNYINFHSTAMEETQEIKDSLKIKNIIEVSNLKIINSILKINKKNEEELKLIHVSRIHPKKNLLFLLEILSKLKIKNSLKLDIFGPIEDQKYWEKCENIILNINNDKIKINYKGFLPNKDISKKMSEYDYSVFPTLGENFGHVIIESLIAKTPVIVSDQTPWKELEKKEIGYDISLKNPKQWEECLLRLEKMSKIEYERQINSIKIFLNNDLKISEDVQKLKIFFNSYIK